MGVFVIAEAGVNHDGERDKALALVEAAAEAGADAVKFQTFVAERLVVPGAPKADYQARETGAKEDQLAMLKRLELDRESHAALAALCRERGIEFMSTAFDADSLAFLVEEIGIRRVKVPSGEMTNGPLLLAMARSGLPLLVSTGMCSLEEVREALGALAFGMVSTGATPPSRTAFQTAMIQPKARALLAERATLLHCTSAYPAPAEEANLRAMDALAESFGLPVGLSDHSLGIAVPVAAAARGACAIEKHLTLDRSAEGPDHAASLEPADFAAMVEALRTVEAALGVPDKQPSAAELPTQAVARRSLVALAPIRAGEALTEANMGARRPGDGIAPMRYWELLGQPAHRDYRPGERIEP